MGDRSLDLGVSPTDFVVLPPMSIGMSSQAQVVAGEVQAGFEVAVAIDGNPLKWGAPVQTTGSDPDLGLARAEALDLAAQRWVASSGLALLDALAGGDGAPALAGVGFQAAPASHGAVRAYAAFPQLRGQGLEPKLSFRMGPNVALMGRALGPYLADLAPVRVHFVVVRAKLGGGGPPGACGILPPLAMGEGVVSAIVPLAGDVVVDGGASQSVCPLSEAVSWPLPGGGVSLEWEQVFVVAPVAQAG